MISVKKIDLHVFRYPIDVPVRTSFGVMHDRPAVLIRTEDADGNFGWGEAWCNFPACGAEHRYKLCATVIAPILLGSSFGSLGEVFQTLTARTHILALQCREPGPLAQAIAGTMGALWDMEARKAGKPLYRFLADDKPATNGLIPAYASGINSLGAVENVQRHQELGYDTFKVKIGFDFAADIKTIESVLDVLKEGDTLNVDVNQAWSFEDAQRNIAALGDYPLGWIEEPIASDHAPEGFAALERINAIPIAAGENIYGLADYAAHYAVNALGVVQPDACKWGGPGLCLDVARDALAAGAVYCPHFLGAGIGLWTSAHILAAAGGPGKLEVDVNHNPLQDMLGQPRPQFANSAFQLTDEPGIGVVPDLDAAREFTRESCTVTA